MTFKNPLHVVPGVWRQKGRKQGGAAPVAPTWHDGALEYWEPDSAVSYAASLTGGNGTVATEVGASIAANWVAGKGWSANGIAGCLDSTIVPVNNQQYTLIVEFSDLADSGALQTLAGVMEAGGCNLGVYPGNNGLGTHYYQNGGQVNIVVPVGAATSMAVAGPQGYLDGVPDGGAIPAQVGAFVNSLYICAANNAGVRAFPFVGYVSKIGIWVTPLSAVEVAARVLLM